MKCYYMCFCVLALTLANTVNQASCARILAAVSTPSYSHQRAFRPLWRELALRGHEVVLLTTDLMDGKNLTNLKQIDLHDTYNVFNNFTSIFNLRESFRPFKMMRNLRDLFLKTMEVQLQHPEVQRIVSNQSETFDVVIVEYLNPVTAALSTRFNCPFIGLVSFDGHYILHEIMGNPAHPILFPYIDFPSENLSFIERLKLVVHYVVFKYYLGYFFNNAFNERITELMHFNTSFYMKDATENMKLSFINSNPIFYNTRPLAPGTVNLVGNQHIEKPKPLPEVCYSCE